MNIQQATKFLQELIKNPIKFALYLLGLVVLLWVVLGLVVFLVFNYWLTPSTGLKSFEESYALSDGASSFAPSMAVSRGGSLLPPIDDNYLAGESGDKQERKIIKTGSLSMLVSSAEKASDDIKGLTQKLGGFVESTKIYESTSFVRENTTVIVKNGNMSIRIPDDKFEEALTGFKELAIKVESETTNASDVTDQVVDIEVRLKNMRAEEEQYRTILNRATEIKDVLDVTSRLSDVRSRIERLQAQLDTLGKMVSLSTINVSLKSEADLGIIGKSWRPLSTLKSGIQGLLSGLTGFIDSLILFIIAIPIYLLYIGSWVLGLWILWRVVKYLKAKIF